MRVAVHKESGTVIVDGKSKKVNLTDLANGIEAAVYSTVEEIGFIQFDETQTEQISERDLEGEREENSRRASENLPPLEKPMYRLRTIRKRARAIEWKDIEPFYNRWIATPEPKQEESSAEKALIEGIRDEALSTTFGDVTPLTRQQILQLSRAEYRDWFLENFSTAQDLRLLLARMFRYLISRR